MVGASPVMITEWYAKGMDLGLGQRFGRGLDGAHPTRPGFVLPNLRARSAANQQLRGLALVQISWTTIPTDLTVDPSNQRFQQRHRHQLIFVPYQPLLDLMRPLNQHLYRVRDYFAARNP